MNKVLLYCIVHPLTFIIVPLTAVLTSLLKGKKQAVEASKAPSTEMHFKNTHTQNFVVVFLTGFLILFVKNQCLKLVKDMTMSAAILCSVVWVISINAIIIYKQGQIVRQKSWIHYQPVFFCSSLMKSEPTWSCPEKLKFIWFFFFSSYGAYIFGVCWFYQNNKKTYANFQATDTSKVAFFFLSASGLTVPMKSVSGPLNLYCTSHVQHLVNL